MGNNSWTIMKVKFLAITFILILGLNILLVKYLTTVFISNHFG